MQSYEYKVVPAPVRGEKERGLKTGAERFAHTLSQLMNELAQDGWEYWRAETLPAEERSGLTSKTTVFHNLLVFRRVLAEGRAPVYAAQPMVEGRGLSVFAPEGKAPRLGPAEESHA
ncbi:DUF4177 domain-containing protein [Paenirhodobacter sp.]|uniref:DUF4177 domain-containing protein n=1 Tax=Paenirhodobacter sp. TaxID=1965326 RepID=UPI003B413B64